MNAGDLNKLSMAQLHQEARIRGLSSIPKNKAACIEAILEFSKGAGSSNEDDNTHSQNVIEEAQDLPSSAQVFEDSILNNRSNNPQIPNSDLLHQFCSSMKDSMQKQQEMFNQLIMTLSVGHRPVQAAASCDVDRDEFQERTHLLNVSAGQHDLNCQDRFSASTGNAIKFLSSQIPSFSGTEDEDIDIWIEKIETVAELHGLSSVVMLSAATSKLSKTARKWFDFSTGPVNKSWISFREEIIDRFRRKVLFNEVIQKVNARKWNFSKESFQEYAMDKLALMRNLKLSDEDSIQLLIKGIGSFALRATAASLRLISLNQFLREMQHITSTSGVPSSNSSLMKPGFDKSKNNYSSDKLDDNEECLSKVEKDRYCTYCHRRNHLKEDCFKLKRKELERKSIQSTSSTASAVVEVDKYPDNSDSTVALVSSDSCRTFSTNNSIINVISINGINSGISALLDSGSPISFIGLKFFKNFFGSDVSLNCADKTYKALNGNPIKIIGTVLSSIILEPLPLIRANVLFHVLHDDNFSTQIILGRDFLIDNKISCLFDYSKEKDKLELFSEIASTEILNDQSNDLKDLLNNSKIDFDENIKRELVSIILEVENSVIIPPENDYFVKIKLKDDSIFRYSPRRFAWNEKIQIREIIDDLLKRKIIKESSSEYCSRIVPVKKKNGTIRLCVDLRPLNERVYKQKYPFPIIEDCLTKISNKSIFSILDLKDGFHNIKIHPDHTKFFAFATPDGQYEFNRLPFGYCEAPAEFEKRLFMILQSLIKEDKIIVYIDDILIPSFSVYDNLDTLKRVLLLLKQFDFKVNYNKCAFLKTSVEFLGYVLSPSGISLSPKHTMAVANFPIPKKIVELQRFLGLTNYFRRFIKDYSVKCKPLQNLLKKDSKFIFDDNCRFAFDNLKKELTSYPVLRLYNPSLETELHTDASSIAIAGILLQKQVDGLWAPVSYFSQSTNKAEVNYHSFELEMLAIVRAVERFHIYLYGLDFVIVTDCNSLVFALNKINLNHRIARWSLKLQDYSFKVKHRDGKHMVHVDALSRISACIEYMPLEKELQFRQLQDPKLKVIAESLSQNDHEKFELFDGLVYRKGTHSPRFVVPEEMINNVIRSYHDNLAHCGFEKTIQGISAHYWFPSFRKRVKKYINNCLICLFNNDSSNSREGNLQITDSPSFPYEIVHVDHFGPLKTSIEGFKHILIIIDAFTRFTNLFPVKSTSSKETIKNLSYVFSDRGNPSILISDRGSTFTSLEFSNFVNSRNIKHSLIAVAAPWANGLVERVNKFLKSSLKKIVEDHLFWYSHLETIQYVINNTYHSALKASPSKLLFGYDQRNHSDSQLSKFLSDLAKVDLDFNKIREDARITAIETTNRLKEYNKIYYDEKHSKPSIYKSGDFVLIRDSFLKPGEDAKLKPKFKGPYIISKVLNKNRYVVQDIPGFNVSQKSYNSILSSDRIKPWSKP